jgi:hypothetical protein
MFTPKSFFDGIIVVLLYFPNKNGRESKNYYPSILVQEEENHKHNVPGFQVKFRLEATNTKCCC